MYKVQVFNDDNTDVFRALTYGEKHPSALAFIESKISSVCDSIGNASNAFFKDVRTMYDSFNSSEAMRLARLALNKVSNLLMPDRVLKLATIEEIQSASVMMQRWIMAQPDIRQMYQQQRCDGFSESYVDMSPGDIGEKHYDYRRVMNGVLVDDVDNDYVATFYLDELAEGDRELSFDEQLLILDTWTIVKSLTQGDIDPTSQYGDKF